MKHTLEATTATLSLIIIIAYWFIWEIASYAIEKRFAPLLIHHKHR